MGFIINPHRFTAAASNGLLTDLESYYKFEEASGTLYDSHGANDGTAVGTVNYQASGKIDYALDFAGGYTKYGDVLDFDRLDPHSFAFWVNPDTDGMLEVMFSKYDTGASRRGYFAYLDSADKISYTLRNNDTTNQINVRTTTATVKAADGWVHIVITYDGSSDASGVTIYKNGASQSLTTVVNGLTGTSVNANEFNISGRNNGNNLFNGQIDEVGIWSRELDATDVAALYNSGSGLSYDDFTS